MKATGLLGVKDLNVESTMIDPKSYYKTVPQQTTSSNMNTQVVNVLTGEIGGTIISTTKSIAEE